MKREKSLLIGDVLKEYLKQEGLNEGILRVRVFEAWDLVVGDKFVNYTAEKYFKNGRLICSINSSAARSNLFADRASIQERINKILGEDVVTSVFIK